MYRIVPIKGNSFIVNKDHTLSLRLSRNPITSWFKKEEYYKVSWYNNLGNGKSKNFKVNKFPAPNAKEKAKTEADKLNVELTKTYKDAILDISVSDYLKKAKRWKTYWKLYRTKVEFPKRMELDIDPYLIGLWLGDGTSSESAITTIDVEIVNYLQQILPTMDMTLVIFC